MVISHPLKLKRDRKYKKQMQGCTTARGIYKQNGFKRDTHMTKMGLFGVKQVKRDGDI